MKEYIKNVLIKMIRECKTDKYGQIGKWNFTPSLFGDKANEVERYCKENKILQFSTYGGRFGAYKAFTIVDEYLLKECRKELIKNENYLRNINTW